MRRPYEIVKVICFVCSFSVLARLRLVVRPLTEMTIAELRMLFPEIPEMDVCIYTDI